MAGLDAWPWSRPRCGLALTRGRLLAIGPGGREERELPEGLIAPDALAPNVQSVVELARIASEALERVAARGMTLALAMPDLAVTTAVLPARGRPRLRDATEALAQAAPYPLEDARVDGWRGRRGELLSACVRESVAVEYQRVAEANDCALGWVDAASLARLPEWAREAAEDGLSIQVQLYDGHFCLSAFLGGELVELRIKLRGEGDLDAPEREVRRVPPLHDDAPVRSVRVFGPDAEALAARLGTEAAAESGHLDAVLASLMKRGRR